MSILVKPPSADVSAIKANTDNLTPVRAGYLDFLSRDRPSMLFPSATPKAIIVVPAVAAADLPFPDVVVAGLPSGITIARADIALVLGALFDTSSAENQIAAASKTLRVKASAAGWAAGIPALTFVQNTLQVPADTYRGGPILFGGTDIKGVVTGDDTYNFQSDHDTHNDCVIVTGASLELLDVFIVIRVWFN